MKDEKKGSSYAWVRLPLAILQDERLTPYEAIILSILIDRDTGTHSVSVSAQELAALSGISRRKVWSCIKVLKATGYIVESDHESGGTATYTIAEVLPPKKRGQAQYNNQKKKNSKENDFCDMEHFEEDYEIFMNNF